MVFIRGMDNIDLQFGQANNPYHALDDFIAQLKQMGQYQKISPRSVKHNLGIILSNLSAYKKLPSRFKTDLQDYEDRRPWANISKVMDWKTPPDDMHDDDVGEYRGITRAIVAEHKGDCDEIVDDIFGKLHILQNGHVFTLDHWHELSSSFFALKAYNPDDLNAALQEDLGCYTREPMIGSSRITRLMKEALDPDSLSTKEYADILLAEMQH